MNTVEKNVMATVAVIYGARLAFSATALKLYALLLSGAGIVALVSVSNVVHNFESVLKGGVPAVGTFVLSAVSSTTLLVQLALAVGVFAFISLFAPTVRSLASSRTLA